MTWADLEAGCAQEHWPAGKRCVHGMLPGLCVVVDCPCWDGRQGNSPNMPTLRTCIGCGAIMRGRGLRERCAECRSRER